MNSHQIGNDWTQSGLTPRREHANRRQEAGGRATGTEYAVRSTQYSVQSTQSAVPHSKHPLPSTGSSVLSTACQVLASQPGHAPRKTLPPSLRLCVKTLPALVAAILLLTAPPVLTAQEPDADVFADKKEADPAADKDAAEKKPAAKKDAPQVDAGKKAAPPKPLDPTAIAIRDSNPTTPQQLLRAIDALLSLDALPLAEEYFKRLAALPLTDAQRVALGREFDPGLLFRIAQTKSFGPDGPKFVNSIFEALRKAQENPQQLARLVESLGNPDATARGTARAGLAQTGRAAIGPLVRVLADPKRKNVQPDARAALAAMGNTAVEPLLAVLAAAGPDLKPQIVAVLAQSNDPRASEALLVESVAPGNSPQVKKLAETAVRQEFGDVSNQLDVAGRLMRLIDDYMRGERRLPADVDGMSEVWFYNPQTGDLTSTRLEADKAAAFHAVWLAARLGAVAPGSPIAKQWQVMASLNFGRLGAGLRDSMKQGPGRVTLEDAVRRGPAVLEPVLRMSLEKNHMPAALGALEALAESRDPSLLTSSGARPNILVKAAAHGDRRIRLAAIEAIAALKPTQPMAGSSAAASALLDFANFSGTRRAVVADPRSERAHALAALLDQCGFLTSVATTGREAFQEAASSTEVELVLIVMTVEHPDAEELLRQLRRDPRTARLPVGLIADPDGMFRAEGVALADRLSTAFVRPRDQKTMQERVTTLARLEGVNHVPHAERSEQAARALKVIAALLDRPQKVFDLQGVDAAVEPALYVPELAPLAAQVLARSRTQLAQKALVDLASAATQPIATRQAAAAAFAESVKRHGIQLSSVEIQQQARLYDQGAALDQPTQDVLWSLLETMQKTKEKTKKDS